MSSENLIIRITHALLDSVDVFIGDSSQFTRYASCGMLEQKNKSAIKDAFPCFFTPKALHPKNILIRIRTSDVCAVAIESFEYANFINLTRSTNVVYGLYFGAILILIIINIFLFASVKFKSSLWYSLYIMMFAAFQAFASGLVELRHVFNIAALLKNGTPIFACLCIACGAFFASEFLALTFKDKALRAFKIIFVLFGGIGLTLAIMAGVGFGTFSSKAVSIASPPFLVATIAIGIVRIRQLGRPAIFFTTALCLLAAGNIVNSVRNLGVIPNIFIAEHGNIIGSALEFLIIALALVDRIATIEKKKNEAYRQVQYANQLAMESRLKALQAQINPHFLFNTLNTLAELVTMFPGKAEKLVLSLSKFFRYTLTASEKKTVKLKEEIEIVETYLTIEKERFGKRLDYAISVVGPLDTAIIPGLLLQPIVENSVKHGIAILPKGGRITLTCVVNPETVHITIHDTGPGFDFGTQPSAMSHGLYNVKERLQLIYGGDAQLTCTNRNGAFVELVLPMGEAYFF
jgi:signal transduction histidine kinase